jgi:YHS domain-containing protein
MDRRIEVGSQPDPALDAGEETLAFPKTVCHRTITDGSAYYPKSEYHGRIVYFCTETCLNTFLGDPERFYQAHSRWRADQMECEFDPDEEK